LASSAAELHQAQKCSRPDSHAAASAACAFSHAWSLALCRAARLVGVSEADLLWAAAAAAAARRPRQPPRAAGCDASKRAQTAASARAAFAVAPRGCTAPAWTTGAGAAAAATPRAAPRRRQRPRLRKPRRLPRSARATSRRHPLPWRRACSRTAQRGAAPRACAYRRVGAARGGDPGGAAVTHDTSSQPSGAGGLRPSPQKALARARDGASVPRTSRGARARD
jgi:hypothetical protein